MLSIYICPENKEQKQKIYTGTPHTKEKKYITIPNASTVVSLIRLDSHSMFSCKRGLTLSTSIYEASEQREATNRTIDGRCLNHSSFSQK